MPQKDIKESLIMNNLQLNKTDLRIGLNHLVQAAELPAPRRMLCTSTPMLPWRL